MNQGYQRPTDEIAHDIGKATVAWNDIQFAILQIFLTVVPGPREDAEARFFSLRSDRGQRKLVRKAVEQTVPPVDTWLAERILEVLDKLDGIESDRRNAAVHAIWMIDLPTQQPVIYQQNYLGSKGDVEEVRKELRAMTEGFMKLAADLFGYRHDLWHLLKFGRRSGLSRS